MKADKVERKLAAILAADVEGYSRLMGIDEVETLRTLQAHRAIMDRIIAEHRGRIFNTAGDSVLAEFPSVVDAVQCAVDVQQALSEENSRSPSQNQMRFRIAVHVGDVVVQNSNLFGDGVNIAARLEGLAEPGGICISSAARDHLGDRLPLSFENLGDQVVKNIAAPVRVYRVSMSSSSPDEGRVIPLPNKPSIAVLPFMNMSGDPEQEYFADGLTEDITMALSRIRSLFVIARNSSFTYKGRAGIDVKQVGRELGVRYVLEGSVRKAGTKVRITGQLIDAEKNTHLWADRYDGVLEDIFDLQDRVTESVVGAVEPSLRKAEIERSKGKRPESLLAYDYMLRALQHFHSLTREGNEEALRLLRAALRIDPSYGIAYALSARLYVWQDTQGWSSSFDTTSKTALRLAQQALDCEKDDPEVLFMVGNTTAYFGNDPFTGLAFVERSLVLNPNSAQAWLACGWVRLYVGIPERALECFEKSARLSPLDPLMYQASCGTAFAHLFCGRFEQAREWAQKSMRENDRYLSTYRVLAAACAHLGFRREAAAAVQRILQIKPDARLPFLRPMAFIKSENVSIYIDGLRKAGHPE